MKVKLRLIRARPSFCTISNNPNVSLGIVECSLYTRHIALTDDFQKKRMDKLASTPVDFNYLETLAKTSIIPARQKQVHPRKLFQQSSSSSDCHCSEYKLCIFRIVH